MAQAVKWQIPFSSLLGVKYRIDIYADGYTGTPIQLLGGPNPFVTDEAVSDNFFDSIRPQTGNIQICTELPAQDSYPNGGTITLDDILPANNLDHPVRLIRVASGGTETIQWQGFLSCESYSQEYTAIPQIISLPVISVLEAMDSVEVEIDENMAFKTIMGHIAYAMKAIEDKSGMSLFNGVFISNYCSSPILSKYFYSNVYFVADDLVSGENITVEVHSISCKEILQQVSTFFGCCWREVGQNIYLEAVGKSNSYAMQLFSDIKAAYIDESTTISWFPAAKSTADMVALSWRGATHQRSVYQGRRRVKVVAHLKDFECNMSLRETPVGSLVENPSARQAVNGQVFVNTNETFYSLAEHQHLLVKAVFPTDLSTPHLDFVSTSSSIGYSSTIFWADNDFRTYYRNLVDYRDKGSNTGIYYVATSFMAWWRDLNNDLQSGLMICGIPKYLYWSFNPIQSLGWTRFALTESNYLYKQSTPLKFAASSGFLKIDVNTLAWSNAPGTMPSIVYGATVYPTITMAVKFGNKWAHYDSQTLLYTWEDTFQAFEFPLEHKTTNEILRTKSNWNENLGIDEDEGRYFPIPSFMVGIVTVYLFHEVNALCADPYTNAMFDVFITKLDVEYVPPKRELHSDRSENTYAEDTGKTFKDELTYDTDLATYANNTKLATMVWDDSTTPAKLLSLNGANVRPEVDLLGRLKSYYSEPRQKIELYVEHPTTNALPRLNLNGINDGKTYAPLAESRDWQKDISTLTCFETENE